MIKSVLLFSFLMLSLSADAQKIYGKVTSDGEAVPYANIYIKGTSEGTSSDESGMFFFKTETSGEQVLIVSSVGFITKKIKILVGNNDINLDISLKTREKTFETFVVTGTMKEVSISESPVKVEVLSPQFFKSNITSNLMGAIENVNGIQKQVNCGVCGTNDIRINGMEGAYTLVMIDGMPIVSALASVYGFNGIPPSLIERVEIVKGPSSTLYGTEAVGGIINIITKTTENIPTLMADAFYTSHQELNTDLSFSKSLSEKVKTGLSLNYFFNENRIDFNNDGFTDIPLAKRVSIFNKWQFGKNHNLAFRYFSEDRFGGVLEWTNADRGSSSVYGESILTNRFELIGSSKIKLGKEDVRINYSYNSHHQDSYYANTFYLADQEVYFANFLWNKSFNRHDVLFGMTQRYQTYRDNSLVNVNDKRYIPGIFLQDEFNLTDELMLLGGIRFDAHNSHGTIVSPRFNIKYELNEFKRLRFNYGTGFRQVNLFTEDHAFLTGARSIKITEDLNPERSQNFSLNYNQTYGLKNAYGTLDFDLFYTFFSNKIIPDFNADPNLIIYENLSGYGTTRGFALNIDHRFGFPLKSRIGGTYQEVFEIQKDGQGNTQKTTQVLSPSFSGIFALGYTFQKFNLNIDYTGRVVGPMNLPVYREPFQRAERSDWFAIQNLQITKTLKIKVEVYGGIKNLFNYTQESPLINPKEPFSNEFDTSYAYGPLQTRRGFVGLRWKF